MVSGRGHAITDFCMLFPFFLMHESVVQARGYTKLGIACCAQDHNRYTQLSIQIPTVGSRSSYDKSVTVRKLGHSLYKKGGDHYFYLHPSDFLPLISPLADDKTETQLKMTSRAESMDQCGFSLVLEQAIETAVARAVVKAMANSGNGAMTSSVPLNHPITPAPKSQGPRAILPGQHGTRVDRRVPSEIFPPEIWKLVFQYLFPSQLSRVSMVCHEFYEIVTGLPLWSVIYAMAHPNNKNHVVGGIKLIQSNYHPRDYMLYVCAESLMVCELCFAVNDDPEVTRDRLASFPLPVHMWRVRAAFKDVTFLPYSVYGQRKDWTIRLCLRCRRMVFARCPESITFRIAQGYGSEDELVRKYQAEMAAKREVSQPVQPNQHEENILATARLKYGGDVGIAAAGQRTSSEVIKSMESRLAGICFRLTVEAMDC
ncbi:MAG: hypothetical protein J3Q66DRAFT_408947 [Benniella sp.]|nr:MAG: hypothetical protein J3Q66DRAFT_408947 [Benniella sp.]